MYSRVSQCEYFIKNLLENRGFLHVKVQRLFTPFASVRVNAKSAGGEPTIKLPVWGRDPLFCPSEKSRFYKLQPQKVRNIIAYQCRIAQDPGIARGSGAQRPGYRPTRVLHATVPSSPAQGPSRKQTAKFEPAAWSWAQS